jgi:hypothetical protein
MTTGHLAGESDGPVNKDGHRTERIRSLNDALRQKLPRAVKGCRLNVTSGVAALHPDALARLLDSVRTFERFTDDNDPHGEHDFGVVDHDGLRFFWKIDAFDQWMQFGSPDPTDPAVTTRVLTLMLAEEY